MGGVDRTKVAEDKDTVAPFAVFVCSAFAITLSACVEQRSLNGRGGGLT
jgi:hypothetical protein